MRVSWDILLEGRAVIAEARVVLSRFGQLKGLMFSAPRPLVFDLGREKPVWMHMMFVFYPIDVVLLDEGFRAVAVKPGFRPFAVYVPGIKARYILELEAGSVDRLSIRAGSRFGFQSRP
ncbi:MAG: DUF192 domain-containing protein [Candidatus Aminicenantales bacterium]